MLFCITGACASTVHVIQYRKTSIGASMEKHNKNISFTALGLIFGTALGAALALLLGADIYWAGAGTALGLVTGAAIDSLVKRER